MQLTPEGQDKLYAWWDGGQQREGDASAVVRLLEALDDDTAFQSFPWSRVLTAAHDSYVFVPAPGLRVMIDVYPPQQVFDLVSIWVDEDADDDDPWSLPPP